MNSNNKSQDRHQEIQTDFTSGKSNIIRDVQCYRKLYTDI